jgi:5-methyltetrahydropteroyltriglutamate--homocysteine methyltransferase
MRAMAAKMRPPFRAEQAGGLVPPAELVQARAAHAAAQLPLAELRRVENHAIRNAVWLQEALGFRTVTDGDLRRTGPADFLERGLGGFSIDGSSASVGARMRWTRPVHADDFTFLASITRQTPKITLPSPTLPHFLGGRQRIARGAYPDLDAFWTDMVEAFRRELAALYAAGCRYVQIDDPCLARLAEPRVQATLAERGDDWRQLLDLYSEVLNAAIEETPADLHVALNACRSDDAGRLAGSYERIAESLFNRIRARTYFLEYDAARAADFSALRSLPKEKYAVLALLSTRAPALEPLESLVERVLEASRFVPLQRLSLSAQCGFAAAAPARNMSAEQQNAKLRRLVEAAKTVWGET